MSTSSTPPTLAGGAAVGSLSAASTPPRGTAEAGFGVASLAAARTVTHDDDDDVFYPTSTGSSSVTTSLQAARAPQSPGTAARAHTLRSAPAAAAAAAAPSCASMTPELALQRIDKLQADHTALEKALHVCSEQCGRAFDRLASVAGVVTVEALQGVITAPANNGDGAGEAAGAAISDGVSIGSSAASKHAMNGTRDHSGTVDGSSHLLLPYVSVDTGRLQSIHCPHLQYACVSLVLPYPRSCSYVICYARCVTPHMAYQFVIDGGACACTPHASSGHSW